MIERVNRVSRWITASASGLLPTSLSAMVGAATGATGAITASTPATAARCGYKNPKVDALIDEAKQTFDAAKQDELLAQAHSLIVDDAALVWVVHDTNPHALSPRIKKFVQAQHWFQDLTTVGVE